MTRNRDASGAGVWLAKGAASVADQAMVAGANFVINIVLGRWLEPAQYGAFALVHSLFLLLGTFHTAALSEPMLVFGAGKYAGRFRRYLGVLTAAHLAIMAPIVLALLGASALLGRLASREAQAAMAALAPAAPAILLLWLFRRAFYVIMEPKWALAGAASYFALLVGAVAALRAAALATPASAFAAMGAAALVVGLLLALRLRPSWAGSGEPDATSVIAAHWRYARWAMASAALTWIPANLYFVLLPAWSGLQGAAALRALTNLVMPVMHALTALSLLLVPVLARQRGGRTGPVVARLLPLFAAGGALYYAGLVVLRRQIMTLLYGSRYAEVTPLVPVVGLFALLAGPLALLGAALRARERPDRVFWSYLASSAVAAVWGALLVRTTGVAGAAAGLVLSSATTAAMMALLLRRRPARAA